MGPLTKIIATIGPASSDADCVRKLIESGATVFRLNFGHGTREEHERHVRNIRSVAKELGVHAAILGDIQGPKIRLGEVPNDGFDVPTGANVFIQREPITGEKTDSSFRFSTTYENLIEDVQPGQRVLVNDGAVRMLIVEKRANEIKCTVTHGGVMSSAKGINLPETDLTLPVLSERDWNDARWSIEHDLDFLALSFVRSADDVKALGEGVSSLATELGKPNFRMSIISKIELPAAVASIDSIIEASDGIMIARGDLGVEMDLARIPVIQKRLMERADRYGKPCIVATQMLESMIREPAPTRAEASDVAGAIFDRTDAVMLSGETAIGAYPALAVEHMRRIAEFTEQYLAEQPQQTSAPETLRESRYRTAALAHGVWTVAQDIRAKLVIVWSQQGGGARYLSQNNFSIPIVAVSSDERAVRRMQLLRGVTPMLMEKPESVPQFTKVVEEHLLAIGRVQKGDVCIVVAGEPIGVEGITNSLRIHTIGGASHRIIS